MRNKSLLLSVFCFVITQLAGCSQSIKSVGETAKLAIFGQPDVELPVQKIEQLPYASAYLKVGKAPQAFVVLAASEQGRHKWVTADKNMVVTQSGRVVKTIGFDEDIVYVSNTGVDPLFLGLLKSDTPKKWHYKTVWSQVFKGGYEQFSEFESKGYETVTILEKTQQLHRFDEKVTVPALNKTYTNNYWLNPENGMVIKANQYMGPDLALIQFTILKPYAQ